MEQADFSQGLRSAMPQPGDLRMRQRMQARAAGASFAVYLYIGGSAWILSAGCLFLEQFRVMPVSPALFTILAWIAIALIWFGRRLTGRSARSEQAGSSQRAASAPMSRAMGLAALIAVSCAVILLLLTRLSLLSPLDWYIGKGLLLAAIYAVLSRSLGSPVTLLALWQLALTAIVGWNYLGFAPVWLDGFAGAGLLVLAIMLQLWNRGEHQV
jgi:hypothetical protein